MTIVCKQKSKYYKKMLLCCVGELAFHFQHGRLRNTILHAMISTKFPLICDAFSRINGIFPKNYSVWPPFFVEPVINKKDQTEMEKSGDKDRLATVPVKSAKSEHTCSVFYDQEVNVFTNFVMRKGRKQLARDLVEKAFENIKRIQLKKYYKETDEVARQKIIIDPRAIFHTAVANCTPVLQLIPIKRGGATYQVPVPVNDRRARFLAMNWLIDASKETPKPIHFPDTLATELLDASNNAGKVVKKKVDLHRQCEANRAYAHYRWG